MKYEVRVYCTVPDSISLTTELVQELAREKRVVDGFQKLMFDDQAALYHYVRSMDYVNRGGVKRNHILEAIMTNPNDSRRHKQSFNFRHPNECYFLGYLVKDEKGRTIDLRHYERELYAFDNAGYIRLLREKNRIELEAELANLEIRWEKNDKLFEGKINWLRGLRRFRTIQERRHACDSEHKPFIRGKRNATSLPEPWTTEIVIRLEKSWKARSKVKRKWQVNLKAHIDTVYYKKRASDEELFSEDDMEAFD
ncbi:MAG: hypothetical protein LBT84_07045 [Spirochaetia bacterium]|jgi:hypothetical protein|nr:hypothetical protein [Spirochaetia bacterium]